MASPLPDTTFPDGRVAGWSKEETIHSLIRKTGFRGAITDELKHSLTVKRYQCSKTSLEWEDFVRRFAPPTVSFS